MLCEAHLEVSLRHRIGALRLDAAFACAAPWTVLFGPSGSGKSTILRCVAGLLRPEAGRVVVRGRTVMDAWVWVPAHRREVRWAAQKAALFPRMTVRENLEFGGGAGAEALRHFGLERMAGMRPAELSGGERQRVAVVRAAVGARGKLLLLDEPFTGLDAEVRGRLIEDLRGWLGETPVVSVTHDVGEAFLLGAEVVKIDGGRVVMQGPVAEALAVEREKLIAIL